MIIKKTFLASSLFIGMAYSTASFSMPTTNTTPPPSIIGGEEAAPGQFPWQAQLLYQNSFTCSASIINKQWILTAAHCVDRSNNPNNYEVIVGNLKANDYDGKNLKKVSKVIISPDWDSRTITNDVAVIKLKEPLTFSKNVKKINLATAAPEKLVGKQMTVSGWGQTSAYGPATDHLLYADKELMDTRTCHGYFGNVSARQHVCTTPNNTNGVCFGDSGGPLVYLNKGSGEPYQVGITSFVASGCSLNAPNVYTNVYTQKRWIEKQIDRG